MKKILVIGSISTDFIVQTDRRPEVGETIKGQRFSTNFGGKGANQAVAAARLGANVHMVGTVGSDKFGDLLIGNLVANGISTILVEQVNDVESGSAHIILVDNDNSIIYIPGANNEFKVERLDKLKTEIKTAEYVIIQNEIPMSIISRLIDIADELAVKTIYNPAPAEEIDLDLIDKVTYFTPNENEFRLLFPELTLEEGLKTYPNKLIITLGSEGVAYHNGEEMIQIPSYKVKVKDTTGAGDTFNGALAYALSVDADLKTSIQFANLVAAISIQKEGAQGGMPTLEEVIRNEDFNPEWTIH